MRCEGCWKIFYPWNHELCCCPCLLRISSVRIVSVEIFNQGKYYWHGCFLTVLSSGRRALQHLSKHSPISKWQALRVSAAATLFGPWIIAHVRCLVITVMRCGFICFHSILWPPSCSQTRFVDYVMKLMKVRWTWAWHFALKHLCNELLPMSCKVHLTEMTSNFVDYQVQM